MKLANVITALLLTALLFGTLLVLNTSDGKRQQMSATPSGGETGIEEVRPTKREAPLAVWAGPMMHVVIPDSFPEVWAGSNVGAVEPVANTSFDVPLHEPFSFQNVSITNNGTGFTISGVPRDYFFDAILRVSGPTVQSRPFTRLPLLHAADGDRVASYHAPYDVCVAGEYFGEFAVIFSHRGPFELTRSCMITATDDSTPDRSHPLQKVWLRWMELSARHCTPASGVYWRLNVPRVVHVQRGWANVYIDQWRNPSPQITLINATTHSAVDSRMLIPREGERFCFLGDSQTRTLLHALLERLGWLRGRSPYELFEFAHISVPMVYQVEGVEMRGILEFIDEHCSVSFFNFGQWGNEQTADKYARDLETALDLFNRSFALPTSSSGVGGSRTLLDKMIWMTTSPHPVSCFGVTSPVKACKCPKTYEYRYPHVIREKNDLALRIMKRRKIVIADLRGPVQDIFDFSGDASHISTNFTHALAYIIVDALAEWRAALSSNDSTAPMPTVVFSGKKPTRFSPTVDTFSTHEYNLFEMRALMSRIKAQRASNWDGRRGQVARAGWNASDPSPEHTNNNTNSWWVHNNGSCFVVCGVPPERFFKATLVISGVTWQSKQFKRAPSAETQESESATWPLCYDACYDTCMSGVYHADIVVSYDSDCSNSLAPAVDAKTHVLAKFTATWKVRNEPFRCTAKSRLFWSVVSSRAEVWLGKARPPKGVADFPVVLRLFQETYLENISSPLPWARGVGLRELIDHPRPILSLARFARSAARRYCFVGNVGPADIWPLGGWFSKVNTSFVHEYTVNSDQEFLLAGCRVAVVSTLPWEVTSRRPLFRSPETFAKRIVRTIWSLLKRRIRVLWLPPVPPPSLARKVKSTGSSKPPSSSSCSYQSAASQAIRFPLEYARVAATAIQTRLRRWPVSIVGGQRADGELEFVSVFQDAAAILEVTKDTSTLNTWLLLASAFMLNGAGAGR